MTSTVTDTSVISRHMVVALAGNPNTGKSTLFNMLTGYRQHVGNYPGVTVEKRTGMLRTKMPAKVELIDLPGTYSLAASSADEAVVADVLLGRGTELRTPDAVVVVVDAAHLSTNLFLTSQILDIGRPVVIALNMVDVAEADGIRIDATALSHELGVPVVEVVATKRRGLDALARAIVGAMDAPASDRGPKFPRCLDLELEGLAMALSGSAETAGVEVCRIELLQSLLAPGGYVERSLSQRLALDLSSELAPRRRRIEEAGESLAEVEGRARYAWSHAIVERCVSRVRPGRRSRSEMVDRILTHRVAGLAVVVGIMAMCFQAVYTWAAPLMDTIDGGFAALGAWLGTTMPEGALNSLVVNGVVAGVGGVLVFLPQILILFLFMAVLEDSGFMARAAFLLDRWMGLVGLNGKSFIPLLSSFACAVPGIMAARTIDDRRDRLVTILVAPLMSCSARLPVYVLMISAFVPDRTILGGWLNVRVVTLLGAYLLGAFVAIPVILILKRTVLKGDTQPFLLELPSYKWPSVKTVFYRVYSQGRAFCVSAGTIIFAVAIVVWALGYYPRSSQVSADFSARRTALAQAHQERIDAVAAGFDETMSAQEVAESADVAEAIVRIDEAEAGFLAAARDAGLNEGGEEWASRRNACDARIAAIVAAHGDGGLAALELFRSVRNLETQLAETNQAEAGALLRHSMLGRMGHWIEPVVRPLGWDWRIGMAVIASFPAREVVIATMGTIYNLGANADEASGGLRKKLHDATWPDGTPVFNTAVALSIIVFFALCCQCGATLAVIRRETNSWRWPLVTLTYMTVLAYVAAFVTYRVVSMV